MVELRATIGEISHLLLGQPLVRGPEASSAVVLLLAGYVGDDARQVERV